MTGRTEFIRPKTVNSGDCPRSQDAAYQRATSFARDSFNRKERSVERLVSKAEMPHQVLNAKNNEREAAIIAKAGEKGAVTLATNIAGRGTDIVLGDGVKDLGGLFVLGS